jgi:CRP/FNR family cyclic AMP-dependent transcriptional regulator
VNAAELKRFGLLAELLDEDREALVELLETEKIRGGRSIYRETAEADAMILIASGTVRLSSKRSEYLGTLGAGAVLGATSLLAMGQREATAKAETACEVWVLARTAYRRLVDDYPRTACRLTEAIAGEIAGLLREGLDALLPAAEES